MTNERLDGFRARLDVIDEALVELLGQRARVVDELWQWKQSQGLPLTDAAREDAMKAKLASLAKRNGLDPAAVRPIFDAIIGKKLLG